MKLAIFILLLIGTADAQPMRFLTGAFGQYPPIVTSGLSIYYSGANSTSYNGVGNTVYDISGNGNTGNFTNTANWSSTRGGVFQLTYLNNYWQSTSQPISSNSSFTLCVWIYLPSLPNSYSPIIDGGNLGLGNVGYALALDNSNHVYIAVNAGYFNVTALSANTWYFIEATATYGSPYVFHIYINGVDKSSTGSANTSAMTGISSTAVFGKANMGGSNINANYAQAFIYNRALTSAEAIQNYNATKGLYGY